MGAEGAEKNGLRIIGAHIDSPFLKAKPHRLLKFQSPFVIPRLAIHLERHANSNGKPINAQTQMRAILLGQNRVSWPEILANELNKLGLSIIEGDLLEYGLSFYGVQDASALGLNDELVTSARLDNLPSCFINLESFLNGANLEQDQKRAIAFF